MKPFFSPSPVLGSLLGLLLPFPLAAQEPLSGGDIGAALAAPAEAAGAPRAEHAAPVADAPLQSPATAGLPLPEQRLREGLVLLAALHDTMSHIQDDDTAEAAVAPLMRLHRALQEWAQTFSTLPPLTDKEQQLYEENYLPLFRKLNSRIRAQGERLAAAEYYGSRDLPAALMHIALLNH